MDIKRIKEILIKENRKDPHRRDSFIDCFLELDPGIFLLEKCEIKGSALTPEVQDLTRKRSYRLGKANRLVTVKWH